MATVQQWGRKESVIWPPRGYVYTLGAFIFACILTGVFIYIRFQYGLSPLQRYYLPYYLRTETAGLTHPVSQYQLLYVSDGEKAGRAALDSRRTARLDSPIRRQAVASDAYSRGGEAWRVLSDAREPSRTIKTRRSMHGLLVGFIRMCRSTGSSRCSLSLASLPSPCSFHSQFGRTFGGSRIFAMDAASKARSS